MCGVAAVFAVLVLQAAAARQGQPKSDDAPEVALAMQDLSDAMQIKPQFNNFLERVNTDTDKLHAALENSASKTANLELEKDGLQTELQQEKQRLSQELQSFKQKMISKITDLKTTNRRLEQTNMQLVQTNDKLASDLESEKGKKELLVKKLQKMASMFNKQQNMVQNIISQNSKKLETEVSSDVKDALSAATSDTEVMPTQMVSSQKDEDDDEDMELAKAGTNDIAVLDGEDDVAVPAPVLESKPVQKAAAKVQVAPVKKVAAAASPVKMQARKAIEDAAAKAKAAAAAKVQAEAAQQKAVAKAAASVTGPVAKAKAKVAPVKSSEDDEQLKALRSEVEKLEQSVKTEDAPADASSSTAPSASMIHVAKRSARAAAKDTAPATPPVDEDASVNTLENVGSMLSAAMSSDDDSA